MILNNYWNALQLIRYMTAYGELSVDLNLTDITGGNVGEIYYANSGTNWGYISQTMSNVNLRNANMGVRLSSDETEPTKTDYTFTNDITASFSNVSFNSSFASGDNGFEQTISITGKNNTPNPLTIRQVGITKQFFKTNKQYSNAVLLNKCILDEPIVVEPNASFSIILYWDEV